MMMHDGYNMYILITLITITGVATFYGLYKFLNATKNKQFNIETLKLEYESNISELKQEIKRQNYINGEYQRKFLNKEHQPSIENTVQRQTTEATTAIQDADETIKDLLHEKRELEKEKAKFQEKTKKLWDQSLAIHKEKERIDEMRKVIEKSHNHVTDSIRYAKNIQQALLPPDRLLNELLSDYFILYKPRDIVSGDFYWINSRNEFIYLVAADCTGHGVPGAFMSMLGISFLNEIVNRHNFIDAADILEKMRVKTILSLHQDGSSNSTKDGMDMALCIIDTKNHEIQYAGAYNPLLIVRNGELTVFKATKSPISYYIDPLPFQNHTIKYETGDCIYIFSDGFSDQFGGKNGTKFHIKKLRELLTDLSASNMPMEQIRTKLDTTFNEWKGDKEKQIDDVLIIGTRL